MSAPKQQQESPLIPYRRDLDGLRGLAVLATVGFHAAPQWLGGGFAGVDVFFVLSGYLIGAILLASLSAGTFSFSAFYARRIKRIFPAVVVVLATSLAWGWFGLYADEYRQLAKHVGGAALFVSNFILLGEVGYFDTAAQTKPLLHFWSLAIEEQFYLLWPLALFLAARVRINTLWVISLTLVLSFAYSSSVGRSAPNNAFYLPHARVWELALGSLWAWAVQARFFSKALFTRCTPTAARGAREVASGLGGILVLLSFSSGWREAAQQYVAVLVPALGTVLLLAAGPAAWFNRRLLSNRLLVGCGLISFPLYLWHWPLFAAAHLMHPEGVGMPLRGALLATSVALAAATYVLIERPIRQSRAVSALVAPLCISMLLICGAAGWIMLQQGAPQRFPNAEAERARLADWSFPGPAMVAKTLRGVATQHIGGDGPQTLFYGDSSVEQYAPRIVKLLKDQHGGERGAMFLTQGGSMPIDQVRRSDGFLTSTTQFNQLAQDPHIDRIVIGAAWSLYVNPDKADLGINPPIQPHYGIGELSLETPEGQQLAAARLAAMVQALMARGKTVYLVAGTPGGKEFSAASDTPHRGWLLSDTSAPAHRSVPRATVDLRLAVGNRLVHKVAELTGAQVIDPADHVCERVQCQVKRWMDIGHLRASYVQESADFMDVTVLNAR